MADGIPLEGNPCKWTTREGHRDIAWRQSPIGLPITGRISKDRMNDQADQQSFHPAIGEYT
jgi:hypothetical protein